MSQPHAQASTHPISLTGRHTQAIPSPDRPVRA